MERKTIDFSSLLDLDADIRRYERTIANNVEKTELTLSLSRYRRRKEGFSAFCAP